MSLEMIVRLARPTDLPRLPEIEVSAATLFRDQGVEVFAGEAPETPIDFTPAKVWAPIVDEGLLWVMAKPDGPPAPLWPPVSRKGACTFWNLTSTESIKARVWGDVC